MYTKNKRKAEQIEKRESEKRSAQQPEAQQRHNPRWFFPKDPDSFFKDLLMEQNEQG
jgi:hypothetical protein